MEEVFFQDQSFNNINLLQKGEYDNCGFNQCDFSNSNLSGYKFTDCLFNSCNLSLTKLDKTTFQQVHFKNSKLLGLRFDTCNEFGLSFSFEGCQLNHASFYKTKIKKTIFKNSQLEAVDFANAVLTEAVFENCDLTQAVFDQTHLEKADFRTATNYTIEPENNTIKKAKFSLQGVVGLLEKYNIVIEP